jgi:flagellar biogenesis protein FliO
MLSQAIAVLFVLLLLVATLYLLRRNGLASVNFAVSKRLARPKFLQVVERTPLTATHSLHLVRVHDRLLLLAVSPSSCSQIDSFSGSLLDNLPARDGTKLHETAS